MSLINNMLKDLEKRKTTAPAPTFIHLTHPHPATPPFSFLKLSQSKHFLVGLIILVTFVSCLTFYLSRPKAAFTIPPLTTPLTPSVDREQSVDAVWLEPVAITGMTMQVKDNITELSLFLSHPALYRLNSDNMSNKLALIIEHAELRAPLPPAAFLNTAIQQLTTKSVRGDTQLNLTLHPGAIIKYVNLNTDQKNAELVIAVQAEPAAVTHRETNLGMVKTPAMQTLLLEQYQNALKAAESGRYPYAIQSLTALLQSDPEYNDARVSLTALLLDQGKLAKANTIVDDGLQLHPGYTPFVELKARILTAEGRLKAAIALLQTAAPSLTDNPEYHGLMAALYARSEHDQEAVHIYQQLLELDPHNGNWWFGLGVSQDKLDRPRDAIEAFSKAIAEGHLNQDAIGYLQKRLHSLQGDNDAEA
jgi:tetratricopeptide (TPR) repeat protein